MSFPVTPGNF